MDIQQETPRETDILLNDENAPLLRTFRSSSILTSELLLNEVSTNAKKLSRSNAELQKFVDCYKNEVKASLFKVRSIDDEEVVDVEVTGDRDRDRSGRDAHSNEVTNISEDMADPTTNFKPKPTIKSKRKTIESSTVPSCFTTGDETIDKLLNGGIPTGYVIEISGGSATGKTNLLMNLAITVQLPREFGGLGKSLFDDSDAVEVNQNQQSRQQQQHRNQNGKGNRNGNLNWNRRNHVRNRNHGVQSMYIPTESLLPTTRLEKIANHYKNWLVSNGITSPSNHPATTNVLTTATLITDLETQEHILTYQLPEMLKRNPHIKLIILDSITHHLRAEVSAWDRDVYTLKMMKLLKRIAMDFNVTVLIANQVTDRPLKGIYWPPCNNILLKMNMEYQTSWLVGWDDVGVVYRQLKVKKRKNKELDDFDDYGEIGYADGSASNGGDAMGNDSGSGFSQDSSFSRSVSGNGPDGVDDKDLSLDNSLRDYIKSGKRKLFESSYKSKVSKIKTIPALGLTLLKMVDMRIVLMKEFKPILNENMITEFGADLGIINPTNISSNENDSDSTGFAQSSQEDNLHSEKGQGTQQSQQKDSTPSQYKKVEMLLKSNDYLSNHNFETQRLMKVVFSPLIPSGESKQCAFEIWNGGIRSVE
ncbi:unnamed protein product [Ambrosiozyma monospora]|uniref:Unnamed protein product n=1 Tax=Ambrosiozyma monospora TaxID=43982 RepID=A0A9W6YQJ9_AMBMO|nr:unnamed protein product [Ambrosiozyma monospora]